MAQKKKSFPYLERDISWMYFNHRILQESTRHDVPLLERMTFLGISPTIWMNFPRSHKFGKATQLSSFVQIKSTHPSYMIDPLKSW